MSRAILRHRAALRDLADVFVYLGRRSPSSGRRFLQAAERTFAQLALRPGIGAPHLSDDPAFRDVRICPITRFRSYLIFYRATDDRLEVLRILHGRRDTDHLLADALPPDDADAP